MESSDFELYRYTPSLGAAIVFAICFGVCMCVHGWKFIRGRLWYLIPLEVGAMFETAGYIGRAVSSSNPTALGPFIAQALTILLGPALFAASIYMVLGRTILLVEAEHHSIIRARRLTNIFVGGDVLSFMVQSGGAGLMSSGNASSFKTGANLIVVGLALQLAFFGFFVVVAGIFHWRMAREPTAKALTISGGAGKDQRSWSTVLWTLYCVSGLILLRSLFRLIEYAGGNDGYLISHEIFLYIFDALLMFVVLVILIVFHPSEVISDRKPATEIGVELN